MSFATDLAVARDGGQHEGRLERKPDFRAASRSTAEATRTCSRCRRKHPLTPEFFYHRPDGGPIDGWCHKCRREYKRTRHRSDADQTAAVVRFIRSLGRRLAEDDPVNGVPLLASLEREITAAWEHAVTGWRASGSTNRDIGAVLGTTGQAVGQRWPRAAEEGGR